MIVVIGTKSDAHLPFVLNYFKDGDIAVIDPVNFVKGKPLNYHFEGGKLQVEYESRPIKNVTGVWYRRPSVLNDADIHVQPEVLPYARSAINRHALSLSYLLQDATWVSNFAAMRKAGIKPLQLEYAHGVGFRVPDTLFVSNAAAAEAFVAEHGKCIAKPQGLGLPDNLVCYAKVIDRTESHSFAALKHDPYILQQYIRPQLEYRVTVVGSRVFAAVVNDKPADPDSFYRDWRAGQLDNSFRASKIKLSAKLEKQCVELVRAMGLAFGALDLIQDSAGRVWFLEINPHGQWAFIEKETGQPIGLAVAELLAARKLS